MNTFNELILKISLGSSGGDRHQSGNFLQYSETPPPPNMAIESSSSDSSLPPPPGFFSQGTTPSSSPPPYRKGEGPPPTDGLGGQEGSETQDIGPPETGGNNTHANQDSFPHPPQGDKSKSPDKTGKGKSQV